MRRDQLRGNTPEPTPRARRRWTDPEIVVQVLGYATIIATAILELVRFLQGR